jgi:hypothetical protein
MLGHKQISRAQLGVKHQKIFSNALGNKMYNSNSSGGRSVFQTPNNSSGINNNSNSSMVVRQPIMGAGYRPEQRRHPNIEKPKPPTEKNGKFA